MNIKQVILLRTHYPDGEGGELKIRFGKLIAQGLHAEAAVIFGQGKILPAPDDTEPVAIEREACAALCDSFAAERIITRDRLKEGDASAVERSVWVDCKRTEAERCASAIRARGDQAEQLDTLVVPLTEHMRIWWTDERSTKVVLEVRTEKDLLDAHRLALARGLPTVLITDAGMTEFGGEPTHTAVAIGPALTEDIDRITGRDGLVPTRLI